MARRRACGFAHERCAYLGRLAEGYAGHAFFGNAAFGDARLFKWKLASASEESAGVPREDIGRAFRRVHGDWRDVCHRRCDRCIPGCLWLRCRDYARIGVRCVLGILVHLLLAPRECARAFALGGSVYHGRVGYDSFQRNGSRIRRERNDVGGRYRTADHCVSKLGEPCASWRIFACVRHWRGAGHDSARCFGRQFGREVVGARCNVKRLWFMGDLACRDMPLFGCHGARAL